jgi:hypothetical protein
MSAQFINNDPQGEDLFHGKAQERVAQSISLLIKNDVLNTKLVGLEGSWGSGKSNVIRIIEGQLTESHHLYIHDAWGHQEDLQRRAFLEELTEDLYNKQILDSVKWRKKLNELLSKTQETYTKTVPKLSTGIIITAMLAFITPITTNLADEVEDKWAKYVILSAPIIFAFIFWAVKSLLRKQPLKLSELFYIYKEKELENHVQTITSEDEPSARQFKKWMKDLSDDLGNGSKKLIVVFDNMDRLPPEKVQMLWSSINTFFSDNSFANINVIIPFDRHHIQDAFNNDAEVADQFINKTFPVIFRVAQPVLTDWQSFFNLKFTAAFGSFDHYETLTVRKIFDLGQKTITPRNIIAFINEMVATSLTVEADISLRYIALFVLNKQVIQQDPVSQILNLTFIDNFKGIFESDPKVADNIAAIVYNVPKSSASQIVLVREIELALRNEDDTRIKDLSKHTHFLALIEQMSVVNDRPLPSFIKMMTGLELPDDEHGKTIVNSIWERLNGYYIEKGPEKSEFNDSNKALISNCSEDGRRRHVEMFTSSLSQIPDVAGSDYAQAILDLEAYSKPRNFGINVLEKLPSFEMTPENYIKFLGKIKKIREELKVTTDEEGLNLYLIEQIEADKAIDAAISHATKKYSFAETIQHLHGMIKAGSQKITKGNLPAIYDLLQNLSAEKPYPQLPDEVIESLLPEATATSSLYHYLVAARLGRGSKYAYAGSPPEDYLEKNDKAHPSFIREIAKRIELFISYGDLLLLAGVWEHPLWLGVTRKVTLEYFGVPKMNITTILKSYKVIYKSLGLKHSQLMAKFNLWASYAISGITSVNINKTITWPEFYDHAIAVKNELTRHLIKCYVEYLKLKDIKSWKTSLVDQDEDYINTFRFLRSGHLKSLPSAGVDAFKQVLLDIANGTHDLEESVNLMLLYQVANKSRLKVTVKNIRDTFINTKDIDSDQFKFFIPMFLELADLQERALDVVRRILLPALQSKANLATFQANIQKISLVLAGSGEAGFEFIEQLESLKDSSKVSSELLRHFKPVVYPAKKKKTSKQIVNVN